MRKHNRLILIQSSEDTYRQRHGVKTYKDILFVWIRSPHTHLHVYLFSAGFLCHIFVSLVEKMIQLLITQRKTFNFKGQV